MFQNGRRDLRRGHAEAAPVGLALRIVDEERAFLMVMGGNGNAILMGEEPKAGILEGMTRIADGRDFLARVIFEIREERKEPLVIGAVAQRIDFAVAMHEAFA